MSVLIHAGILKSKTMLVKGAQRDTLGKRYTPFTSTHEREAPQKLEA